MFFEIKEKPAGATNGIPVLNEIMIPNNAGIYAQRKFNLRLLVEWIQRTPEALGILRAIATDVVTKTTFRVKQTSKSKGRPSSNSDISKIEKAEQFCSLNSVRDTQIANVIDWLMTGDFYTWIGLSDINTLGKDKIMQYGKEICGRYGVEFKETDYKQLEDEDYFSVNKLRYVPSETMEIDYGDTEVKGYIQTTYATFQNNRVPNQYASPTGFQRRYWEPKQIIHGKFMEMSGKVYGYTPMYACTAVIRTLGLIKDYAGTFFENGGYPDYLFMFESQGYTNSKNINEFKEELQKYKLSANKHGNLVGETSGKFQALKLNDFSKDMEFRQLMVMYAGLLAFSVGFPSNRLKAILGADITSSTGETDAENDAYWRSIEQMQDYLLSGYNTQLWIPYFGVEQEFSRGYRQDEVREVQRDVQKLSYLKAANPNMKIEFTKEYVMKYLNVEEKDIKEISFEEPELGIGNTGILPNNKVLKGSASQAYQEEKKKQVVEDKNKQLGN